MSIISLLKKRQTDSPLLALAPMAGVTDIIFREICESLGADYSVTEMLASSPQLINSQKNSLRLNFTNNTNTNVVQIVGNNPSNLANATAIYSELGADIIDLNFGCPAKKISKKGAGASLLKDLKGCQKIIKKVVKATSKPVTVKTRLGWFKNQPTIFEFHKIVQDLGVQLLTIHGRFGEEKFNGNACYDLIAQLKQESEIPIVANGDINSIEKINNIIKYTKCDGLMIGRAAIGKPWIFNDIQYSSPFFDKKTNVTPSIKHLIILSHIKKIHDHYGDKGVIIARKHIKNYLLNIFNSDVYFRDIAKINDPSKQMLILKNILINE